MIMPPVILWRNPMPVNHPAVLRWRTSTRCSKGTCVEVAPLVGGGVAVRDTKDRSLGPITVGVAGWADFVAGLRDGDFG